MPKNALFLLKNHKNRRELGAPPQTSNFWLHAWSEYCKSDCNNGRV